jgi:ATP-dependent RNA circularization protein (DNA/RNA ligase family)
MEYPKINSLWKREGWYFEEKKKKGGLNIPQLAHRQSFIIGDYACPEFGLIKKWLVHEKIDGTNIRIRFQKNFFSHTQSAGTHYVTIKGRATDSQIPPHLLEYLQREFNNEKLFKQFEFANEVILFGEGFGPKIQCGEGYQSFPGFILFDVYIDGWWLNDHSVREIADKLGIPQVPKIGIMSEEEIVEFVKSKPASFLNAKYGVMEGVVCRTEPLIMHRSLTHPIKWKLKCKEYFGEAK